MVASCAEQAGRSRITQLRQVRVFTREVKFLGHILSQDRVRSHPVKVAAVVNMEEPSYDCERIKTLSGNGKSTD